MGLSITVPIRSRNRRGADAMHIDPHLIAAILPYIGLVIQLAGPIILPITVLRIIVAVLKRRYRHRA